MRMMIVFFIALLEHFQEKWNPVFRPKMRQCKNAGAVSVSSNCETALAIPVVQVASGPFERSGARVVVDRNNTIIMAFRKSLLTRDREDPAGPRSERRPKAS